MLRPADNSPCALTSPRFANNDWLGWLETDSDVLWWKAPVPPGAGGMGKDMMWRKKWSTTDVLPGQRRSVPAASRQRGTQAREQRGFVCIQWNCFCTQSGFQLLWGRRKALLATLKCLVLPAFGSMRGARTKYTTVQCKLSDKKLIPHRASWTTWKQGGVDGLPCRSTLPFHLE